MTELVTFRLANYETPLWSVDNFAAGRYNAPGSGPTQYLGLHPLTPWAELLRNEDRRSRERALQMRYPLWAIRVELAHDPFVLSFDEAVGYGVDPADLVADDHRACRRLAARLRESGPRSLLVPSAALPGTTNLVVLEPRVLTGWSIEPVDEQDWPGSMAAQDGRCPDGLWDLVRYRGSRRPHAAYRAWQEGTAYEFEEPPVMLSARGAAGGSD